jgi:hypothetical protein
MYGAGFIFERNSEEGIFPELIAGNADTIVLLEYDLASVIESQSDWTNNKIAVATNQVFRRNEMGEFDSVGERETHLLAIADPTQVENHTQR